MKTAVRERLTGSNPVPSVFSCKDLAPFESALSTRLYRLWPEWSRTRISERHQIGDDVTMRTGRVLLVVALLGCGSDRLTGSSHLPDAVGVWTTPLEAQGADTLFMRVTLAENGLDLGGSALTARNRHWDTPVASWRTVTGRYGKAVLEFYIRPDAGADIEWSFLGSISGNRASGLLFPTGAGSKEVTFTRE